VFHKVRNAELGEASERAGNGNTIQKLKDADVGGLLLGLRRCCRHSGYPGFLDLVSEQATLYTQLHHWKGAGREMTMTAIDGGTKVECAGEVNVGVGRGM
jgi:hypothetical protein